MHFDLSDDQRDLRDGIRSLLAGAFPIARVREGFDRSMWDELVEAGVFGLRADGFTWADAAVVFEELGRAVVPGPLVWGLLAHDPTRPARIVGGLERPAAGTPAMVEYLSVIDALVVLDADGVSEVDPSTVTGDAIEWPLDPLTPVTRVAELPAGTRTARPAVAAEWLVQGAVLTSAYAVGMADACTALVGGLRQGARAVRSPDRFVPGGEAPLLRHGSAGRGRPRRDARGRRASRRPDARRDGTGGERRQVARR